MPKKQEATPAAETQQEAAQTSDTKAEATGTSGGELSENDLEAVAGGVDPRIDARVPNIPID